MKTNAQIGMRIEQIIRRDGGIVVSRRAQHELREPDRVRRTHGFRIEHTLHPHEPKRQLNGNLIRDGIVVDRAGNGARHTIAPRVRHQCAQTIIRLRHRLHSLRRDSIGIAAINHWLNNRGAGCRHGRDRDRRGNRIRLNRGGIRHELQNEHNAGTKHYHQRSSE